MEFFDTHTHLPDGATSEEAETILAEAAAAGVKNLLLAGTSVDDAAVYLPIVATHTGIYTSVGVHPEACRSFNEATDMPKLREWLKEPGVVAIGEVGLDAHYEEPFADEQESCFRAMLRLADETNTPVVIHSRDAFERCYRIVGECLAKDHSIQVHSFADTPRELDLWLERNAVFSYNGMVTFKKAENIRTTLRLVPLDRLLLETDAPYLTPTPFRGQPNSSRYIPLIAQRIADERSLTLEEVAKITTENARRFFRLP